MFSITLTRYQKCGLFGLLGIVLFVVSVAVALNSVLVGMLGGCFGSLCAVSFNVGVHIVHFEYTWYIACN